jgi:hypothetical protein
LGTKLLKIEADVKIESRLPISFRHDVRGVSRFPVGGGYGLSR